jgi:SCF-associated factor 1
MNEEVYRVGREMDEQGDYTKAKVAVERPGVISCRVWDMTAVDPVRLPHIPGGLPKLSGMPLEKEGEETKLVKIAGMDNHLIGLTNKGHVLIFDRLSGEDTYQQGRWQYVCLLTVKI